MPLRILKTNVDGTSGHLAHLVRVEEEIAPGQISYGPEETIAIWPHALMMAYHGAGPVSDESMKAAHMRWLNARHIEVLQRKRNLEAIGRVASGMQGQLVALVDDKVAK